MGKDSSCTSNNTQANSGGNDGTSNSGSSSSGDDNAAGTFGTNILAVVGVAIFGALALF